MEHKKTIEKIASDSKFSTHEKVEFMTKMRISSSLMFELSKLVTILSEDHELIDTHVREMMEEMIKGRFYRRQNTPDEELRLIETGFDKLKSNFIEALLNVKKELKEKDSKPVDDNKDKFIESFSDTDQFSKADITRFASASDSWIFKYIVKHKGKFRSEKDGIFMKSFLNFLKSKDIKIYNTIKTNYTKEFKN